MYQTTQGVSENLYLENPTRLESCDHFPIINDDGNSIDDDLHQEMKFKHP